MTNIINEDIYASEYPAVVFITGEHCGPCKMMKPIFLKMVEEFEGQVLFHFVDAHENLDLMKSKGIKKVPTTLLIKNGVTQHTITGPAPDSGLRSAIKGHLLRESKVSAEKIDFTL